MEEALDPDLQARAFALDAAMWFYDKTGGSPESVADVVNIAEMFTHYLTNGQANEFHTDPDLSRCISGGI